MPSVFLSSKSKLHIQLNKRTVTLWLMVNNVQQIYLNCMDLLDMLHILI